MSFYKTLLLALLGLNIAGGLYKLRQDSKIPKNMDELMKKAQKLETAIKEIGAKDPQLAEHLKKLGIL